VSTKSLAGLSAGARYRLAPATSLRREQFGGLAYSHLTRRLQIIESRLAVEVAVRLDRGATVADLVAWLARGEAARQAAAELQVAAAVRELVSGGVLVEASVAAVVAVSGSPGVVN
jgi:putative mycofactocin binding protein MftB